MYLCSMEKDLKKEHWKYNINSDTYSKDIFRLKLLSGNRIQLKSQGSGIFQGTCLTIQDLNAICESFTFDHLNTLGYRSYYFFGKTPDLKGLKIRKLNNYPNIIFVK